MLIERAYKRRLFAFIPSSITGGGPMITLFAIYLVSVISDMVDTIVTGIVAIKTKRKD